MTDIMQLYVDNAKKPIKGTWDELQAEIKRAKLTREQVERIYDNTPLYDGRLLSEIHPQSERAHWEYDTLYLRIAVDVAVNYFVMAIYKIDREDEPSLLDRFLNRHKFCSAKNIMAYGHEMPADRDMVHVVERILFVYMIEAIRGAE